MSHYRAITDPLKCSLVNNSPQSLISHRGGAGIDIWALRMGGSFLYQLIPGQYTQSVSALNCLKTQWHSNRFRAKTTNLLIFCRLQSLPQLLLTRDAYSIYIQKLTNTRDAYSSIYIEKLANKSISKKLKCKMFLALILEAVTSSCSIIIKSKRCS